MEQQSKEEFCGACLAIPAAMAGLGASKIGSDNNIDTEQSDDEQTKQRNRNRMLLWIGIVVTVISMMLIMMISMESKWGLVPDMGGMALTRGLVRPDRLRELIYSGRVVNGDEACALGLATHVVDDPHAAALAAAREIAHKSPDAIRAAKRLMRVVEDGDTAAILLAESIEQDRLIGAANQREAVLAGMENRHTFGNRSPDRFKNCLALIFVYIHYASLLLATLTLRLLFMSVSS